LWFNGSYA